MRVTHSVTLSLALYGLLEQVSEIKIYRLLNFPSETASERNIIALETNGVMIISFH